MTGTPLVNHPQYRTTRRDEARYHYALLLLSLLGLGSMVLVAYAPERADLVTVLPLVAMALVPVAQGLASDPATVALWHGVPAPEQPSNKRALHVLLSSMGSEAHRDLYGVVALAVLGYATSGDSIVMIAGAVGLAWLRYARYVRSRYWQT